MSLGSQRKKRCDASLQSLVLVLLCAAGGGGDGAGRGDGGGGGGGDGGGERTGTPFLLLCGVTSTADSLATIASAYLGGVWPVSDARIADENYDGFWQLQLVTVALSLLALPCYACLVPGSRAAVRAAFEVIHIK